MSKKFMKGGHIVISDPPFAHFLFSDVRAAWLWLAVRLYVGWAWLEAGWGKLHAPAWTGEQAGASLTGFVQGAFNRMGGAHPDVQGWYGSFLEHMVLPHVAVWSHVVAWGEFLVGLGLILGAFTGIAAFFGLFMNLNFLLAGAVSTNPILLILGVFLVLAWRVAGFWGLDRFLLPWFGVPWRQRPV